MSKGNDAAKIRMRPSRYRKGRAETDIRMHGPPMRKGRTVISAEFNGRTFVSAAPSTGPVGVHAICAAGAKALDARVRGHDEVLGECRSTSVPHQATYSRSSRVQMPVSSVFTWKRTTGS